MPETSNYWRTYISNYGPGPLPILTLICGPKWLKMTVQNAEVMKLKNEDTLTLELKLGNDTIVSLVELGILERS
jgi:hypothetical protein